MTTEGVVMGAQMMLVENRGLPADRRCARCDAQAYVEVEVPDAERGRLRRLEFCAHHYLEHEEKLRATATRIIDYRPFLARQERQKQQKQPA